ATLAAVHRDWADTVDSGAPVARCRVELLTRLGRLATPRPGDPSDADHTAPATDHTAPATTVARPDLLGPSTDDEERVVADALLAALTALETDVRAAVAADLVWDLEPAEYAQAARMPSARLTDDLAAARAHLVRGHRAGLAAVGRPPADWRVDADLAALLNAVLARRADPPDAAALVLGHDRHLRRRTVLVGGGIVLAAGATAWAGWRVSDRERASPARVGRPAPTSPVWTSTQDWPARGPLVGDVDVQAAALRSGPGSRLLWAGEVGTRRVAVAGLDQRVGRGTVVRLWTGPLGVPAATLQEEQLAVDRIEAVRDIVAVRVVQDTGAALLLLTRPTVTAALLSTVVIPTSRGEVRREWTGVPLADGVGIHRADDSLGPATRVRVGGYEGPPVTSYGPGAGSVAIDSAVGSAGPAEELLSAATTWASLATGLPVSRLRSTVVVDSIAPGSVLDEDAMSATGDDGRVVVVHTRTPDGAVLRSVRVRDDGRARRGQLDLEIAHVIPADAAGQPYVAPLPDGAPGGSRYLVVAPGAVRVRLLDTDPGAGPISAVTPTKGDVAVVLVTGGIRTTPLRLVAQDGRGRQIFDGTTAPGRPLVDPVPGR
ncbi:MAG: hypothetical protein ACRCY8_01525, partial [Dermatophilaceae bacterium]